MAAGKAPDDASGYVTRTNPTADALSRYHGRPGTRPDQADVRLDTFYRKSSRAPARRGNGPPRRSRPSA